MSIIFEKKYNDTEFINYQLITIKEYIQNDLLNNNTNINMSYLQCHKYITDIIMKIKVKINPHYIMGLLQNKINTSSINIFNLSKRIYFYLSNSDKIDFKTMKEIEDYIIKYCYLDINLSCSDILNFLIKSKTIIINDYEYYKNDINLICNNIDFNEIFHNTNRKKIKII